MIYILHDMDFGNHMCIMYLFSIKLEWDGALCSTLWYFKVPTTIPTIYFRVFE